jgi:hypothetical protein
MSCALKLKNIKFFPSLTQTNLLFFKYFSLKNEVVNNILKSDSLQFKSQKQSIFQYVQQSLNTLRNYFHFFVGDNSLWNNYSIFLINTFKRKKRKMKVHKTWKRWRKIRDLTRQNLKKK